MDGSQLNEYLSQALDLLNLPEFCGHDGLFVKDPSSTAHLVVVRPMNTADGVHGCKLAHTEEDWKRIFDEVMLQSTEKNSLNPTPTTLVLILASPERKQGQHNPRPPITIGKTCQASKGLVRSTTPGQKAHAYIPCIIASLFGRFRNWLGSVHQPGSSSSLGEQSDIASAIVDLTEPAHDRKRLRKVPFTFETFQYVMKRMSIHSSVARLICQVDVPTFEKTTTEMTPYLSSCATGQAEPAIIYNLRTSNARPNDLAVTVTHFPTRKLTFAVVFGCSMEQEKTVVSRLKDAGENVVHPMLLPGIIAELERKRQFDTVDDMTDELERHIFELDLETVTTQNQHNITQAERSWYKRRAWLDVTSLRSTLWAQRNLLARMRKHLDEFPPPVRNQPAPVYSDAETAISEVETKMPDLDSNHIKNAAARMKDRLLGLTEEYDEKIRDCSMRVDAMAMAAQWSQGEKSLAIATATGQDSRQMRSIAFITMVFLPGTFFASFFSMSFFNWDPGPGSGTSEHIASSKIWIYFAVTVAFTSITLALFWNFVLHRQKRGSHHNKRRLSVPHITSMISQDLDY